MEFIMERTLGFKKYSYSIVGNYHLTGEANVTLGIALRAISVKNEETGAIYQLKQTNRLVKLLNALPLISMVNFTTYKCYINGKYVGKSSHRPLLKSCFFVKIGSHNYEIYCHNDNYISIMKGDIQAALVQKETLLALERNRATVLYDQNQFEDFTILFLLTVYADISFFPNPRSMATIRYEKTVGRKDKNHEKRTTWMPKYTEISGSRLN